MLPSEICARRLANQRLTGDPFPTPAAAVRHLGAVQAQDYAGAKWALSMRTGNAPGKPGATDAELDALFDAGKILRTHVLRPTWHFVAPEDIRWMLDLTTPRVRQAMAFMNRKVGLDDATFKRSRKVLEKALRDRQYKTRDELAEAFRRGGVDPGNGIRLAHLMMDAELEGLVTSGPRARPGEGRGGKQFTYALMDERVPSGTSTLRQARGSPGSVTDGKIKAAMKRDEALAALTRRYFTGHGPAQAADFAWWSGLTLAEVRRGIESLGSALTRVEEDGKTFWRGAPDLSRDSRASRTSRNTPVVHLLPNYDEYFIAYKDRAAIGERLKGIKVKPRAGLFDAHILFVDRQVAGGWRREIGKKSVTVEVETVGGLSTAEREAVKMEAERFGRFLGMEVSVELKR